MLIKEIEQAFLNISLNVNDRDCLRFLWVDDAHDSNLSVVVSQFVKLFLD